LQQPPAIINSTHTAQSEELSLAGACSHVGR